MLHLHLRAGCSERRRNHSTFFSLTWIAEGSFAYACHFAAGSAEKDSSCGTSAFTECPDAGSGPRTVTGTDSGTVAVAGSSRGSDIGIEAASDVTFSTGLKTGSGIGSGTGLAASLRAGFESFTVAEDGVSASLLFSCCLRAGSLRLSRWTT